MGRIRTAALAAGLLLAACGDDDQADPLPTTTAGDDGDTTTTAGDDPTTTEATAPTSTTTFAQADTPPPLVNTGEDFDAIVRSFVAYGSWLGAHPSVDALAATVRRDGPEWQRLLPIFTGLVERGERDDGSGPAEVVETRVLERPSDDHVLVFVVLDNPAFQLVDAEGAVVTAVQAEPRHSYAYELRRDRTGQWFIENRTLLGDV